MLMDFRGGWGGGLWGKHISLAAIFVRKHISLVICVRGNTYHGGTHITVTPGINCWDQSQGPSNRKIRVNFLWNCVKLLQLFIHSNLMKMPDFFNLNNFNPDLLVGGEGHKGI